VSRQAGTADAAADTAASSLRQAGGALLRVERLQMRVAVDGDRLTSAARLVMSDRCPHDCRRDR
jgi:hypothetical protein